MARRNKGLSLAEEELSQLIREIYHCAYTPENWGETLRQVTDFVNACNGMFVIRDKVTTLPVIAATARIDPNLLPQYAAHYWKQDLWIARGIHTASVGTTARGVSLVPFPELRRTEFYNDFLIPNDGQCMLFGVTTSTDAMFGNVTFCRREDLGEFEDEDVRRLATLLPHLEQASQIALKLGGAVANETAFEWVVDHMTEGVILLDDAGKIMSANGPAQQILKSNDGLSSVRGELRGDSAAVASQIKNLIAGAVAGQEQPTLGGGGMLRVARPSGKGDYALLISSLPTVVSDWSFDKPAAIAFISDPERQAKLPPELLKHSFGLTPAEAKFAVAFIENANLKRAAEEVSITEGSARIYLKRIFDKTGVNGQAALVKLLLSGLRSGGSPPPKE